MKLSNIASIWWVRLRARLGQELLALAGIAVGVSLLFAALVANTSLIGSFERTMNGLVGDARFQLMARGGVPMGESTVRDVQRLEGVKAAAPALEARIEVEGPNGSRSVVLIGFTPAFARVNTAVASRFSAAYVATTPAIALPAPLAQSLGLVLGQRVTLNINGVKSKASLAAQLAEAQIGALVDSPIGVAPLRYVQRLSGQPGKITRVFVLPDDGRDAEVEAGLRRLAGQRFDVRPADFEAELFRQASQPSNQSTSMFSIFSAMVGFLFAFSAVLLTVPARRLLIDDLLLEGYGAATTMKVMLFDALALGVSASALGILVGDQIVRQIFSAPPSFLGLAFPYGAERIVTPDSIVLAALCGVLASCIAVLVPTAAAVNDERKPIGRTTEPGPRRRARADLLVVAGLAAVAAGIAVVVSAPGSANVAIGGLVFLTAGMLLLLPVLLRLIVAGIDVSTGSLRSVVPYVALADLRSRATRIRAVAVAATGAVAVFGSVALQGAHADLQRGLDRTSQDLAAIGDVWAVPPGRANLLATVPFRAPELAMPRGIERLASFRGGFLDIGDRRVWVLGSPSTSRMPVPRGQVLAGDAASAARRIRAGGWVLLSETVASALGVGVGDRIVLPTAIPIKLRVAALTTNMGWPPGAIVMGADDYARAWGSEAVSAVQATLAPGTSPGEGARALRAALGPNSGLDVQTAATRERDQRAASREGLVRLSQIATLVLVSAMIAMATAMTGLIWQRRPFLASVKLEGYSAGELWCSLVVQAALLVGAGCAIGAAFGLLGQRLLARALSEVTGFPVSYVLAWPSALLTCVAVTTVVVTIVSIFGYRAAQIAPESEFA